MLPSTCRSEGAELGTAGAETLSVIALIAVLAWAVIRPRGWPEAVAAVPAAALVIATGAIPLHDAGAEAQPAKRRPKKEGKEYDANVQNDDDASYLPDASATDSQDGVASLMESAGDPRDPSMPSTAGLPPAIPYDEWSADRGAYVRNGVSVRLYDAVGADPAWLQREMQDHAATVRQIRHQFERLRARRALLAHQQRGDALDLAACVDAVVDRRLGNSPDDRLYIDARPARRG